MANQRLDKLLQRCIVRLNAAGSQGTGFFVSPGLILTCAHVVSGTSNPVDVFWREKNQTYLAKIKKQVNDPDVDLALLKLTDGLQNHPCVYFDQTKPQLKDHLYTFGYPFDTSEDYSGGESRTVEYEGDSFKGNAPFLTLKQGQIKEGSSGSPLLNLNTGGVCGIIVISRDTRNASGGRAVPTNIILSEFPELIELNHQFHQQDKNWINIISQKSVSSSIQEKTTQQVKDLLFQFIQAYELSSWEKVIELGENILKLNAKHQPTRFQTAHAYKCRGMKYFEESNYNSAIEDFSRAIQLNPNKADYYSHRGLCYLNKGDLE